MAIPLKLAGCAGGFAILLAVSLGAYVLTDSQSAPSEVAEAHVFPNDCDPAVGAAGAIIDAPGTVPPVVEGQLINYRLRVSYPADSSDVLCQAFGVDVWVRLPGEASFQLVCTIATLDEGQTVQCPDTVPYTAEGADRTAGNILQAFMFAIGDKHDGAGDCVTAPDNPNNPLGPVCWGAQQTSNISMPNTPTPTPSVTATNTPVSTETPEPTVAGTNAMVLDADPSTVGIQTHRSANPGETVSIAIVAQNIGDEYARYSWALEWDDAALTLSDWDQNQDGEPGHLVGTGLPSCWDPLPWASDGIGPGASNGGCFSLVGIATSFEGQLVLLSMTCPTSSTGTHRVELSPEEGSDGGARFFSPDFQPLPTNFGLPITLSCGSVPGVMFSLDEMSSSSSADAATFVVQSYSVEPVEGVGDLPSSLVAADLELVWVSEGPFAGQGTLAGSWAAQIAGVDYAGRFAGTSKRDDSGVISFEGQLQGVGGIVEGILAPGGTLVLDFRLTAAGVVRFESITYWTSMTTLSDVAITLDQSLVSGWISSPEYTDTASGVLTSITASAPLTASSTLGFASLVYETGNAGSGRFDLRQFDSQGSPSWNGVSTDPNLGSVSAVLTEGGPFRTLVAFVEVVDGPGSIEAPILFANLSVPDFVSPGQTITYGIDFGNAGRADAIDVQVVDYLPPTSRFVSAQDGGSYDPVSHAVIWNVGTLPARSARWLSLQVVIDWGLPQSAVVEDVVVIGESGSPVILSALPAAFRLPLVGRAKFYTYAQPPGHGQARDIQPFGGAGTWDGLVRAAADGVLEVVDTVWALEGQNADFATRCKSANDPGGKQVAIRHELAGTTYISRYLHLSRVDVQMKPGGPDANRIRKGDPIGFYGNTGCTTGSNPSCPGCHLHFTISQGSNLLSTDGLEGVKTVGQNGSGGEAIGPPIVSSGDSKQSTVLVARDPNAKHVSPSRYAIPNQELEFVVEYENEGLGTAYGVYLTDVLSDDLDDTTLQLIDGGLYEPQTRTITWFVGEVGPGGTGQFTFRVNLAEHVLPGALVSNGATVYFASVPEVTPTNTVSVLVLSSTTDIDEDGEPDVVDNCPVRANPDQADADGNGEGDACDPGGALDSDADGVRDNVDVCVFAADLGQADSDGDGYGDACDDDDGDGVVDINDACPIEPEDPDHRSDDDGCPDLDEDGDGVLDEADNCLTVLNVDQADLDGDGLGDVCDNTPGIGDEDADLVADGAADPDGAGPIERGPDLCPATESESLVDEYGCAVDQYDPDLDGLCSGGYSLEGCQDSIDNCPLDANLDQTDTDDDGSGNACDLDDDGDGCSDLAEVGERPELGGGRDPLNYWDFFDVTGDGAIAVDLSDVIAIMNKFGSYPGLVGYDATFDRYAPDTTRRWRTAAAAGPHVGIDVADAILNLQSFGHHCV